MMRQRLLSAPNDLKHFWILSVSLQKKDILLSDARFIFDKVRKDYVTMTHYLFSRADIVNCKQFKMDVTKIVLNRENNLGDIKNAFFYVYKLHSIKSSDCDTHKSKMSYFSSNIVKASSAQRNNDIIHGRKIYFGDVLHSWAMFQPGPLSLKCALQASVTSSH